MPSGVEGFQPRRLTMAREACALKKRELAERVGRSESTISKWESYEHGQRPEPSIVSALADNLSVETNWFFKPTCEAHNAVFYRSMVSELAASRAKTRSKLYFIEAIEQELLEYVSLPELNLPNLMSGRSFLDLRQEDIEIMASEVRQWLSVDDGPIENLLQIIENAGVVVAQGHAGSLKLDGVSAWSSCTHKPYIFLATDKNSGTRRRLDAAHEFGHVLLHKDVSTKELEEHFTLIEDQAMSFAAALLMPAEEFLSDIYSVSLDALLDCKPKWGVSVGAMIKRLSRLGEIPDQYERRLWQYYSSRRWRTKEPGDENIEIEQPLNIKESIELIVDEGESSAYQLAKDIGLSAKYVSSVCDLPEEFFGQARASTKRVGPVLRNPETQNQHLADNVIGFPFRK